MTPRVKKPLSGGPGRRLDLIVGTELPWESEILVDAVSDFACQVRDVDLAEVRKLLHGIPHDVLLELMITTAAMVDVDQRPSELLAWARGTTPLPRPEWLPPAYEAVCPDGHVRTRLNTRIERDGTVARCRDCERERRARERREQRVAS